MERCMEPALRRRRGRPVPRCCRCGAAASEYDRGTDGCYCRKCASALAEERWEDLTEAQRLDRSGFEALE